MAFEQKAGPGRPRKVQVDQAPESEQAVETGVEPPKAVQARSRKMSLPKHYPSTMYHPSKQAVTVVDKAAAESAADEGFCMPEDMSRDDWKAAWERESSGVDPVQMEKNAEAVDKGRIGWRK